MAGQHYAQAGRLAAATFCFGSPRKAMRVPLRGIGWQRTFCGPGLRAVRLDDGRTRHNHRQRRPVFRQWGGHGVCLACLHPPDGSWGHGVAINLTTIQLRDRHTGFGDNTRIPRARDRWSSRARPPAAAATAVSLVGRVRCVSWNIPPAGRAVGASDSNPSYDNPIHGSVSFPNTEIPDSVITLRFRGRLFDGGRARGLHRSQRPQFRQ